MIAPPYATKGETLLGTSSLGHYLQLVGKLQACDLLEMLILNLAPHKHDDDHHLVVILHRLYGIFLLMQAHGTEPNPT